MPRTDFDLMDYRLQVRITRALDERIDNLARVLELRPADVTRVALAVGLRLLADPSRALDAAPEVCDE